MCLTLVNCEMKQMFAHLCPFAFAYVITSNHYVHTSIIPRFAGPTKAILGWARNINRYFVAAFWFLRAFSRISVEEIFTIFFCIIQYVVPESRGSRAPWSIKTWRCFEYIRRGLLVTSVFAGLRVRCTMQISSSNSRQWFHLWRFSALSIPLTQTKSVPG